MAEVLSARESLTRVSLDPDYIELHNGPFFKIDMRYATTDNFVRTNLYEGLNRAFLHKDAAAKIFVACENLRKANPGYRLLIWDALRPRSVQRTFWAAVKDTPHQKYVANPDPGSIHNFGFAVDLSVVDERGQPLDMGTGFDDFTEKAQVVLEPAHLKSGVLTERQVQNRHILRSAMESAGFTQLPHEWWHYDAEPKTVVLARYKIVE